MERIVEGISIFYNYTGQVDCFKLDDDPHGMDGWNWQVRFVKLLFLSIFPNRNVMLHKIW